MLVQCHYAASLWLYIGMRTHVLCAHYNSVALCEPFMAQLWWIDTSRLMSRSLPISSFFPYNSGTYVVVRTYRYVGKSSYSGVTGEKEREGLSMLTVEEKEREGGGKKGNLSEKRGREGGRMERGSRDCWMLLDPQSVFLSFFLSFFLAVFPY